MSIFIEHVRNLFSTSPRASHEKKIETASIQEMRKTCESFLENETPMTIFGVYCRMVVRPIEEDNTTKQVLIFSSSCPEDVQTAEWVAFRVMGEQGQLLLYQNRGVVVEFGTDGREKGQRPIEEKDYMQFKKRMAFLQDFLSQNNRVSDD